MNSALTLRDEHDAHVQALHSEAISRTAAKIARQRADAIAEHERINAEFADLARWLKTPEGQAEREAFAKFGEEQDDLELDRFANVLIVGCAP